MKLGPWRSLALATLVISPLTLGCENWLKQEEYDFEPLPEEPCAPLCDAALAILAEQTEGCDVICDHGPDEPYDSSIGQAGLSNPDFDGFSEDGAECDIEVLCEDPSYCQEFLFICMWSANDLDELQFCVDEQHQCFLDARCEEERTECYDFVQAEFNECDDNATNAAEIIGCQQTLELEAEGCECRYTACQDEVDDDHCTDPDPLGEQLAARQMTPGVWVVPRALIDTQLGRLDGLANEVGFMPLRDQESGDLIGVRLETISEADVIYSLGLRNGDVLLSIHGLSPFSSFEEFRALYDEPRIRVRIRRDGEVRRLTYLLRGPGRQGSGGRAPDGGRPPGPDPSGSDR